MPATPTTTRVPHTASAVHATADRFRDDLGRLLEPGGLTRDNVSTVAGWLDAEVWALFEANEAVLDAWARGEAA